MDITLMFVLMYFALHVFINHVNFCLSYIAGVINVFVWKDMHWINNVVHVCSQTWSKDHLYIYKDHLLIYKDRILQVPRCIL